MELFEPFSVRTCEALVDDERRAHRYEPVQGRPFSPFEIHDPFGLRNAIVPVFRQDIEGRMYGLGTAFHMDGFGNFLTAYHVIDFIEQDAASRPILFLSMHAVIFGTVNVPPDCFLPIVRTVVPMTDVDDPLAALRGESMRRPAIDVAALRAAQFGSGVRSPQTLPIRSVGWTPQAGEIVLAVGFPHLDLSEVDDSAQQALLSEGMFGAYGRVIEVHPEGTSSSNPTPVFVVESDWPSGMSGGPVFNRNGEVVGMVSRSLPPEAGNAGVGFAVYFGLIPDLELLVPTLDKNLPCWRLCWGVFSEDPYVPSSMHASREDAEVVAKTLNPPGVIKRVSNQIGTEACMEYEQ
ncbi:trypsin-like peptidase domain-containing protein [Pseudomonas sp. BIGb0164]|uniref:trypsin-like peptidase domain-containing protein n=1 Tax=Pseudomonas sp. BIGb0164 TaxID=2940605 RepID=UPI002169DED1|nr:trypsin-like peptidase domain-containing protein [Pseudomonas sp. BIGb0164]MCS4251016.1 serine protease Do [Pseudomonas sp. BIGb0164]